MAGFLFINFSLKDIKIISPASITINRDAKLFFAGDLMFDRGIKYYADKYGGNDYIFSQIREFLLQNDLNIVNLEGPITDNNSKSAGTAPGSANNYIFTFNKSLTQTLNNNNIKMVSLGNNHILNFGKAGLKSTKNYLDEAKIGYFGSPDYPRSTSIKINGLKITFIGYNEFSNLGKEIDKSSTVLEILKAKEYSDVIIVYCHWGDEYSKVANSSQINIAHEFIDNGADLVMGSHPHVIEQSEVYKDKTIYYSLGNFVFDQYFSEETRNGLGVIVKINKKSPKDKANLSFEEINLYLADKGQTIIK